MTRRNDTTSSNWENNANSLALLRGLEAHEGQREEDQQGAASDMLPTWPSEKIRTGDRAFFAGLGNR